mgnify:CR=1 FL=1
MATFSAELERLWKKRSKELGRPLTPEESRKLDGELFQEWIDTGRIGELIKTILANWGRDGGLQEIMVLGFHLRGTKDDAHIHSLFRGLLSRRVKAFYEWWPKASEGHVGHMQSAARAAAEAMDIYVEYFISLDKLGLMAEREALREEMRRFQAREPIKSALPKNSAPKSGA